MRQVGQQHGFSTILKIFILNITLDKGVIASLFQFFMLNLVCKLLNVGKWENPNPAAFASQAGSWLYRIYLSVSQYYCFYASTTSSRFRERCLKSDMQESGFFFRFLHGQGKKRGGGGRGGGTQLFLALVV